MKRLLVIGLTLCLLAGCFTIGHEVCTDDMGKLQPGKSTKEDVKKMLGEPSGITIFAPYGETWTYMYSRTSPKPVNFVPIIGAFLGGADIKTQHVQISFDMQGVMKGFMDWPSLLRQQPDQAPAAGQTTPTQAQPAVVGH